MNRRAANAYTPEFAERGYNNRAAVPDHPHWLAYYPEASAEARAALAPKLDLRYGPGPKETLDLFLPPGRPRGTFLFLHGGYWRAFDKSDFSFVAISFVAQGYAVAVANYDLCPEVSIAQIVDECRRAVAWVVRDGAAHGTNAERLVIGGHSAGGHLTAMLYATDWTAHGFARSPMAGGVSLSGLHDLAPIVQTTFNADLRLDDDEAARQSPVLLTPRTPVPLVLVAGADETSEFVRQTRILWDAWPRNRPAGATGPMLVPGRNHFSVVVDFADAKSELTRATLALF
ncbi:MAG: alpha/beta hydrolase [Betaproteobacteria bacterium]